MVLCLIFVSGGDPNGYNENQMSEFKRLGQHIAEASVSNDANTRFHYEQISSAEKKRVMDALGVANEDGLRSMFGVHKY